MWLPYKEVCIIIQAGIQGGRRLCEFNFCLIMEGEGQFTLLDITFLPDALYFNFSNNIETLKLSDEEIDVENQ